MDKAGKSRKLFRLPPRLLGPIDEDEDEDKSEDEDDVKEEEEEEECKVDKVEKLPKLGIKSRQNWIVKIEKTSLYLTSVEEVKGSKSH